MSKPRGRTGQPFPLGATWDGRGVNFALFSALAERGPEARVVDRDDRPAVGRGAGGVEGD